MKTAITAGSIFLLWFLLSGHTEPLLLTLGVLSTLITVYLSRRMNLLDHESYPFHLSRRLFGYVFFLAKEIVLANIDVLVRILKPQTISPQVFTVPVSKKTSLSQVIYANSITLTPGTVTLELKDDRLTIHALSEEAAEDLKTGRMAMRVPDQEDIVG